MKKLFSIVALMVAFATTSQAGILRFTGKHVVKPVSVRTVKVSKATAKTVGKASVATAKATKTVVY